MSRAGSGIVYRADVTSGGRHRRLVGLTVLLAALAGVQLFVLANSTASFFAWTVAPPLAAAFLGAAFLGVAIAAAAAYRSPDWRQLSLLLPVAAITTTLVLVASVLGVDKFHLGSGPALGIVAAWVWFAVYLIVPPVFVLLWWREVRGRATGRGSGRSGRAGGGAGGGRSAIPASLERSLAVLAALAGLLAVILFLLPGTLPWPWALTPLTSRMTGAFLAGIAATFLAIALEDDPGRSRIAALALVGFGILEGVAIVRFGSNVSTGPVALLWGGFLLATTAAGASVLVLGSDRRARRA